MTGFSDFNVFLPWDLDRVIPILPQSCRTVSLQLARADSDLSLNDGLRYVSSIPLPYFLTVTTGRVRRMVLHAVHSLVSTFVVVFELILSQCL